MKIDKGFLFFFTGTDILSNFHRHPQIAHGLEFHSNEQYFMWRKARYFGDLHIAERILNLPVDEHLSKNAKALGRAVTPFDNVLWEPVKFEIMVDGLYAKAAAFPKFKETLITFYRQGLSFVEASPYDKEWGIGLDADHPHATDPQLWKGKNLLGKALQEVARTLALEV